MRRGLGLLGLGLLLAMVQGTLVTFAPGHWLPDLVFLYAVALAVELRGVEAIGVAALLGYGVDLLSGSLLGQHALLLVLACAATRIASVQLNLARSAPRLAFVAALSVLYALGHAAVGRLFEGAVGLDWSVGRRVVVQTGLNALFAPLVISAVGRVSGLLSGEEGGFRRTLRVQPRERGL